MAKRYNPDSYKNEADKFNADELMDDVAYVASTTRDIPPPVIPQTVIVQKAEPAAEQRIGAGRPKIGRKVERPKAMNVYFDPDTHNLLKNMKFYHDIEMKEIPYILTREFFKKYEQGGKLTAEGYNYIQQLLEEVN